MKTHRRNTSIVPPRSALLIAMLLSTLPLTATVQSTPTSSSTAPMDMNAMSGMTMPAAASSTVKPATEAPVRRTEMKFVLAPSPSAFHHMDGMKDMSHDAMPNMTMGPMHGDSAAVDARSDDYSDGVAGSPKRGLHMHGSAPFGMLLIDQLEAFHSRDANGQSWEAEGWYGNDEDKLWLRSEGERSRGKLQDGDLEAFWNHNIAAYWSSQVGVRQELGEGPNRTWAAFGVQGLAPYWFEVEATGYVGSSGRTAARLRADYDMLCTQRLILQSEVEINFHGQSDPARGTGSGLSDAQLGLRLRYEIRREFAPYVGVLWTRRFGATAELARDGRSAVFEQQWVAGLHIWF